MRHKEYFFDKKAVIFTAFFILNIIIEK